MTNCFQAMLLSAASFLWLIVLCASALSGQSVQHLNERYYDEAAYQTFLWRFNEWKTRQHENEKEESPLFLLLLASYERKNIKSVSHNTNWQIYVLLMRISLSLFNEKFIQIRSVIRNCEFFICIFELPLLFIVLLHSRMDCGNQRQISINRIY